MSLARRTVPTAGACEILTGGDTAVDAGSRPADPAVHRSPPATRSPRPGSLRGGRPDVIGTLPGNREPGHAGHGIVYSADMASPYFLGSHETLRKRAGFNNLPSTQSARQVDVALMRRLYHAISTHLHGQLPPVTPSTCLITLRAAYFWYGLISAISRSCRGVQSELSALMFRNPVPRLSCFTLDRALSAGLHLRPADVEHLLHRVCRHGIDIPRPSADAGCRGGTRCMHAWMQKPPGSSGRTIASCVTLIADGVDVGGC